jgi:hypothetical protein
LYAGGISIGGLETTLASPAPGVARTLVAAAMLMAAFAAIVRGAKARL